MRVGAVVVARLSSTRLPGKVLLEVGGRTVLEYVLARLELVAGLDATVVACSRERSDDPLAEWCEARGIDVFRGDLDDVRARVIACAEAHDFDAIARVNADSPWVDPGLLGQAVDRVRRGGVDMVTNVLERTYPYGVSAEVVKVDALKRSAALSDDPEDAEHVTRALYRGAEHFSIVNLASGMSEGASQVRLTLDTEADLELFEHLVQRFGTGVSSVATRDLLAAVEEVRSRTPQ